MGLERLWKTFMSARVLTALSLLALAWALAEWSKPLPRWVVALSIVYLACTVTTGLMARPREPGRAFDGQWLYTVGVDLACFMTLDIQSAGAINFTPLLALPVLEAAILGSRALALGTAALTCVLLLGHALLTAFHANWSDDVNLAQAALTGVALLVLGWLTNQMSRRLVREEARARLNWDQARMLALVNDMVIESLTDGILVVDQQHTVQAANPAAHQMIGSALIVTPQTFDLDDEPAWQDLAFLADLTFAAGPRGSTEITLALPDGRRSHLRVRTERTVMQGMMAQGLCVMFLQDLRELEAQVRTEKLAAMGRLSAAVAHEIRNPLAAIAQANALLAEDLTGSAPQRLTAIVRQNAERLDQIVDDILDLTRVHGQSATDPTQTTPLDALVAQACDDWSRQHTTGPRLAVIPLAPGVQVQFSPEHLRRVLVNLLDNAARYASARPGAIEVQTQAEGAPPTLRVWSDGAPLEPSVRRHLFEPFFSSESRSSGLGLYICRELCERHGADIAYERATRQRNDQACEGNEFYVSFTRALAGMSGQDAPELFDHLAAAGPIGSTGSTHVQNSKSA
jgi:two-component system sensor histidine kinase PilS (NtrC family)